MKTVLTTVAALVSLTMLGATPAVAPAHGTPPAPLMAGGPPDTLVASPAASSVRWHGTKFGGRGKHEGTVALASGMFVIRHEMLTSGTFTIDMRSIAVTDIPESEPVPRRRLREHLLGKDFFDTARYPSATFRSSGAERVGPSRWRINGNLTMRGVTHPLSFDADVQWPGTGHMVATSTFVLDRQKWGVAYRGSSLNDLVDDEMRISLTLDARRKPKVVATRAPRQ